MIFLGGRLQYPTLSVLTEPAAATGSPAWADSHMSHCRHARCTSAHAVVLIKSTLSLLLMLPVLWSELSEKRGKKEKDWRFLNNKSCFSRQKQASRYKKTGCPPHAFRIKAALSAAERARNYPANVTKCCDYAIGTCSTLRLCSGQACGCQTSLLITTVLQNGD